MSACLKNLPVKVLGGRCICLRSPIPSSPCYTLYEYVYSCAYSHREGGRVEIRGVVFALSSGAYTSILYVMVDIVKEGGSAPPTLTGMGYFNPHDGMYARKQPLLLCVLCNDRRGALYYLHATI
jgi:hypothetical protein